MHHSFTEANEIEIIRIFEDILGIFPEEWMEFCLRGMMVLENDVPLRVSLLDIGIFSSQQEWYSISNQNSVMLFSPFLPCVYLLLDCLQRDTCRN